MPPAECPMTPMRSASATTSPAVSRRSSDASSVRAHARQARASASGPSRSETCGHSRYAGATTMVSSVSVRYLICVGGISAVEPAAKPPAWKMRMMGLGAAAVVEEE